MTIAIDASSANKPKKTGVEWYAYRLIEAMKSHALESDEHVVLFSPTKLEGELAELPHGWSSKVLAWPPKRGWMSVRVGLACLLAKPDVLFVPAQGLPSFFGKTKTVGVLHDVEFRRQPDLYRDAERQRLEATFAAIVRRSSGLLAVSQYAKRTACDAYGIAPERVQVTPLAAALPPHESVQTEPFFLVLGRVEKKKGSDLAVRAFEAFKRDRPSDDAYELRFLGGDGFGADEVRAIAAQSPYATKIRFEGYASDAVASAALARATALLALSRAEGFGIAPLEAMRAGTPVIASDIPPFREVGDDAPMFVRADDADAVAKAMSAMVSDASARERHVAAGKERASMFSWDVTARLTWDAIRNVLQS